MSASRNVLIAKVQLRHLVLSIHRFGAELNVQGFL